MGTPYLGEIKMMTWNYPPKGWAFCNGQLLPINLNQALFSLLGTTYGGNGTSTFALPDLQGRAPMHSSMGHVLGEHAGEQNHTLSQAETPAHAHSAQATTALATDTTPAANLMLAQSDASPLYGPPANLTPMDPSALDSVGGSQAHPNMQPYLTLNFCIALQGIFPSRN